MKKSILIVTSTMAVFVIGSIFLSKDQKLKTAQLYTQYKVEEKGKELEPHDQWRVIRSYPEGFDQEVYMQRIAEIKTHALYASDSRSVELGLDWQEEGPGNIGGRVNVITVHPTDQDILYAGAANGGIFKTENGGSEWEPIFDDQPYLAIGAITLDPENPETVYVGTGDRNFSGNSFIGNGIYKSTNGGDAWESIGLEATGAVTEIIIDPTNTNRLFASTLGNPHVKSTERGVYRSDDGGDTWELKLFLSDSSGVIDLIMNPSDPAVLYAAGYNRMRSYTGSVVRGPAAHVFKSEDGGDSWTQLEGGLPNDNDSRIGLAISNEDPSVVYALYVSADNLDVKDIYKSTNAGLTWAPMNVHDGVSALPEEVMGGFGWYFGEVYLNPYNNDQLIVPGVEMYHSLDGGNMWARNVPEWWTYEVHADKHCIAFLDEDSYIIGTDGGLYRTDNNGSTWTDIENLPITQFYHIAVDPHTAGRYGGGAQDNGSMSGNAASFNDWERLYGGDGFRVKFLELDEGAAYYETQNGGLRYKDLGGFQINITILDEGDDRVNWDMPYKVNETTEELFVGTSRLQVLNSAPYGSFEYITEDLTKVGQGEEVDNPRYHTISEIDQPYNNANLIYAGTTDGLVWKIERETGTWTSSLISEGLPDRYVTGIRCSQNKPGTVYVTYSGYKIDDDVAYLYKSEDFGETWTDISAGLPAMTVNDVLIVPGYANDEYLMAALDGGVYFSENGGESWDYLGVGMPFVTVSELEIDMENQRLIAGTYSRSMWSYDISWMDELQEQDNTGIDEYSAKKLITYPNPTTEFVYFETVHANDITIYDSKGAAVLTPSVTHFNGYSRIAVKELDKGIYFFNVGKARATIVKN